MVYDRYAYVYNNPMRYTDPSGYRPCAEMHGCDDEILIDGEWSPPRNTHPTYWRGLTENQLVKYHSDQGRENNCGPHAVANAFSLLGYDVSSEYSVSMANSFSIFPPLPTNIFGFLFVDGFRPTRMALDWATTPNQQVNLINQIASQEGIQITASAKKGTIGDLKALAHNPDKIVIVTMSWPDSYGNYSIMRAHALVLVASDPIRGYGFVNSHGQRSSLEWLTRKALEDRWESYIIVIGSNNMVILDKDK